ncbi:MAG: hypothetical protein ACMUIP_07790 [bacterium]
MAVKFSLAFGDSPEDFFKKYSAKIRAIIRGKAFGGNIGNRIWEFYELLMSYYVYLFEENYKKLNEYEKYDGTIAQEGYLKNLFNEFLKSIEENRVTSEQKKVHTIGGSPDVIFDKKEFPKDKGFGDSEEDFIKKYGRLIYKIIIDKTTCRTIYKNPYDIYEVEDWFLDILIHLFEDNYKRLKNFRGGAKPGVYIARIIMRFINSKIRRRPLASQQEPEGIWDPNGEDERIGEAIKATFDRVSDYKIFIFCLFYKILGAE